MEIKNVCVVCSKELCGLETFNFESGSICQNCYSEVLTLGYEHQNTLSSQAFIRLQHFLK